MLPVLGLTGPGDGAIRGVYIKARRTIWQFIDSHRLHRAWILAYFIVLWTLCFSVPLFLLAVSGRLIVLLSAGTLLSSYRLLPSPETARLSFLAAVGASTLFSIAYVGIVLGRGEWKYLSQLGAHRMMPDAFPVTSSALRDVSLAAGLPSFPALYLIPDDAAVNAIVLGRTPQTAVVAVTRGLATRTDARLQRAVLASLVSRFRDDGVSWTSLLSMLMRPIHGVTPFGLRGTQRITFSLAVAGSVILFAVLEFFVVAVWLGDFADSLLLVVGWTWVIGSVGLAICSLWIFVALLDLSYGGAYSALARNADAEGILLLRNPDELLGALRAVLREDTWLAGGTGFSYLAFVDCGRGSLHDELYGSENRRLAQLEELAFPGNGEDVQPMSVAPVPGPRPLPSEFIRHDANAERLRKRMRTNRRASEEALGVPRKEDL